MADIVTLQARLSKLEEMRASGIRRSSYTDHEVEFRSDAELSAAISDVKRQLAEISGPSVRHVYITSRKGF
jgi:hypothetical protein